MITKTKAETIQACKSGLTSIEKLYSEKCINWSGKTNDTDEYYSEVIAFELLQNLSLFNNIKRITRDSSYSRDNHINVKMDLSTSNRDEENFAKRLIGLNFDTLGLIRDYQVPLKDSNKDKGIGKIDMISFNDDDKILYLIELKYIGNKETLLRATLESYTYYKIVDIDKLKTDFFDDKEFFRGKNMSSENIKKITVVPAVLLITGCNAYNELNDLEAGNRPKLKSLALAFNMRFFCIEFNIFETKL